MRGGFGAAVIVAAAAVVAPLADDASPTRDLLQARIEYERSLEQARAAGDASAEVASLSGLSEVAMEIGDLDRALRLAEEALSVATGAGDLRAHARALQAKGDVWFSMGRYQDALRLYEQALAIAREAGEEGMQADARKNIGIMLKYLERAEDSLPYFEEAREAYARMDNQAGLASALENLGGAYERLGDDDRAISEYEAALEIGREMDDEWLLHHALLRIGTLYMAAGLHHESLEPLRQAEATARKLGLSFQQAWALSSLSRAQAGLGLIDDAIETQRRCLDLLLTFGPGAHVAAAYMQMGELLAARDAPGALEYLRMAQALLEESQSPAMWILHARFGAVYRAMGNLDEAVDSYRRAVSEIESRRSRIVSEHYRRTFFDKHQSVYQDLVAVLFERCAASPQCGDLVEAFEIQERARARRLAEAVAEVRSPDREERAHIPVSREDDLAVEIRGLHESLLRPGTSRAERRALTTRLDRAESEFESLREGRAPMSVSVTPLSVSNAQAQIGSRTAVVAYFVARADLFVFVVTEREYHAFRLDVDVPVLEGRVRNYLDLIARRTDPTWQRISRHLHSDVLAPVLPLLPPEITRMVILPDGILSFLPFETLPGRSGGDDPGGRVLLEDFTISYAPSATVLALLKESRHEASSRRIKDVLLLAYPGGGAAASGEGLAGSREAPARAGARARDRGSDGMLPLLPQALAEAHAVRRVAGDLSEIHVGDDASEALLERTQLDRFRIIHFATHGLVNHRWPSRSALLLAAGPGQRAGEDGFLEAREIYRLSLASDLVVLSACQTARGRVLAGEGVQGLAQAFLHAGAGAVLATLWNVNDESAARFMGVFYEHLQDGMPATSALRAAKLEEIRRTPGATPAHWAPYILIGDGERTVLFEGRPAGGRIAILLITGALGAAGAGLLWRGRRLFSTAGSGRTADS